MLFEVENGFLKSYTEEENGVTEVTIPKNVKTIGYRAFLNCTTLTSITIPNNVNTIGGYVFEGCTSLTSIIIPDSVKSVGAGIFCRCDSLTKISIPEHLNDIEKRPEFYELPEGVKVFVRPKEETKKASNPPAKPEKEPAPAKNIPLQKLPKKTETEMIFDYFRLSGNEDAKLYIELHINEFVKFLIDKQNVDYINQITESTDFLTADNIDALLDYSISEVKKGGSFEIQFLLTNHKAKICGLFSSKKEETTPPAPEPPEEIQPKRAE